MSAPNALLSPSVIDSAETCEENLIEINALQVKKLARCLAYCRIFHMKILYCAFYPLMD